MKSPILLIFVFAITYYFNICDGADNDVTATIRMKRVIVERELNESKTLYAEDTDHNKTQETKNQLHTTMKKTMNSAALEIQEHAVLNQKVENNPCLLNANRSLISVTATGIRAFDIHIGKLKPEYLRSIERTIVRGTNLITQYDKFLLEGGDAQLRSELSKKFWYFKKIYKNMKKAVENKKPVDHSKIEGEATTLIKRQRQEALHIVKRAKKCIDSRKRSTGSRKRNRR